VLVPAIPAEAVDPTGAGDAFVAGFLREWLKSADAHAAARAGVRLASTAVTQVGGRPRS
jgi:sugar/nucleoside kinase (ribokinase family)